MMKFRLYFDKDKETVWLNEMAAKGYEFTKFFLGFYYFEKGEPGRYQYQIDFSKGLYSVEKSYRDFMEEQNIEIVALWGPWVILRKKTADGTFELYSDNASLIEHYQKIRRMFKVVAIIEALLFCVELVCAMQLPEEPFFYGAVVVLGILMLVFCNVALHCTDVINRLKEEEGMCERNRRKPNILTSAGVLITLGGTSLKGNVSEPIGIAVQIIGIVFMLAGLYRMSRDCKVE